jgi:hypothetical protein
VSDTKSPEPILIAPCPFCCGPPCLFWKFTALVDGRVVEVDEALALKEDGPDAQIEVRVFCHECGAEGPMARDPEHVWAPFVWNERSIDEAKRLAIDGWNVRSAKHLFLYTLGVPEGLNTYPRPGEVN